MAKFDRNESYKRKGRGPKKFGGRSTGKRDSARSDRRGPSRFGGRGSDRPEMTEVTCDSCKKRCEVPFKPTSNKPIYCSDCFKKDSGSKSRGSSGSRDLAEINKKLDRILEALEI